jgi:hypothetical protein
MVIKFFFFPEFYFYELFLPISQKKWGKGEKIPKFWGNVKNSEFYGDHDFAGFI